METTNCKIHIANILADLFAENSCNQQHKQTFLLYKNETEKTGITIQNNNDHPLNVAFSETELFIILDNLKDNKSPRPDGIPYEIIKHFPPKTRKQLLSIYNHIWTKNVFPDSWKEVIIIPVLKPNKDQTQPQASRSCQHTM